MSIPFEFIPLTLKRFLNKENWSLLLVKSLLRQILTGIDFFDSRKIIHRNLKPDNLYVGYEENYPVLKIADFGLASAFVHNEDTLDLPYGCYPWLQCPRNSPRGKL